MILQLRRRLPRRPLVLVGASGYAVLDLLRLCQSLRQPVTFITRLRITRLRLDAGLYAAAQPRQPGRMGRPGVNGPRMPTLLGLFSWIALAAHQSQEHRPIIQRTAAWYAKPTPTFVDAIALVRCQLRIASRTFSMSASGTDVEKAPRKFWARLTNPLAYAA